VEFARVHGVQHRAVTSTAGNHDWGSGLSNYLDYFAGIKDSSGRAQTYYAVRRGAVEFFMLDSNSENRDLGGGASGKQGSWLKQRLSASDAPWKVVLFHHPPYSSGRHGNERIMQWPYRSWGAHVVVSGHDHDYERIHRTEAGCDRMLYIVNGLGGRSARRIAGNEQVKVGCRCFCAVLARS
jgi:hypothetical protein